MADCGNISLPGEVLYKGLRLGNSFTPQTLEAATQLLMYREDVIVAGYPKAGTRALKGYNWNIS